jgi:MFS family permease
MNIEAVDPAFGPNHWRLATAQLLSGVGIASGVAVGALLVEDMADSTALAGFAQTATILGAGLVGFPLSKLATRRGRRTSLGLGFGLGAVGALLILLGVGLDQLVVLFLGLTMFGSASAAGLQSRYAATDLAPPDQRARAMSIVIWATTVGSVAGPQLTAPGAALGGMLGMNRLVGPYLFSLVSFTLATLVILTMREPQRPLAEASGSRNMSMLDCLRMAWAHPVAFFGMTAVVAGQIMMVAVMVMTPLHMHHQDMSLALVGIVISGHILGMYGLSPVVGWLSDRFGPHKVVHLGMGLFLVTFVVGVIDALGESSLTRLIPTLFLLGVAWSCTLIAGSAIVVGAVEPAVRVPFQGTVDALMNFGAAAVTAVTGTVLALYGFVGINLLATAVLLGLVAVAVRAWRTPARHSGRRAPARG